MASMRSHLDLGSGGDEHEHEHGYGIIIDCMAGASFSRTRFYDQSEFGSLRLLHAR